MSFLSGLGSALFGGIGSIVSGLFNMNAQNKQNAWANNQRLEAQKYNTSERLASQEYATGERVASQDWNEYLYNQYQSPQAMSRQYSEAGLNPALAVDGSSVGSPASSSAQSAPSGSNAGMASGTPPSYMPYNLFSSGFNDIAGALKSLGEAKKLGIDSKYLEDMLKEQLQGTKLSNKAQALLNDVNYKYLDKEKAASLSKLLVDIHNDSLTADEINQRVESLRKQNILTQNQIDTWREQYNRDVREQESRIDVNLANSALSKANTKFTYAQTQKVSYEIDKLVADTVVAYAHANNLDVNSDQVKQLTPHLVDQIVHNIDLTDADKSLKQIESAGVGLKNDNQRLRNERLSKHGSEEAGSVMRDVNRLSSYIVSNLFGHGDATP